MEDKQKEKIDTFLASCILIMLLGSMIFVGCQRLYKHFDIQEDNPVEEMVESIIEQNLDLEPGTIDFTPGD